ncbi:alpha/beta hydrolase [Bacillus wiedmannii]|uniref:alpha/beta hydrolase n=1 Tax=Bacillus wiedmannii TaxID=1890302 RepID=UPI000BFA526F|nr:alpha/beta fold hydrolase [Bacillus wiedmannii]PEU20726.1 alpha/beta hydrolase [Bacillus wiedmannii]
MNLEILEYAPEEKSKFPPILFIHGAFHGAWCWKENFLPYFSSKGFLSYALSLRGHGESEGLEALHSFSLQDYVEDVMEVMVLLKNKPILVGHSMGGAIVQKILQLHPDKIEGVILMASVPHNGMFKDSLKLSFTNFRESINLFLFSQGKRKKCPVNVFFSKDLPNEKKDEYVRLLQPESKKASGDLNRKIISKSISTKVPVLVLGSKKEWFFSEKTTLSIGEHYKTKPVFFPNMSHDMMLDPNWKTVADQIIKFLDESVFQSEEGEEK